LDVLRYVSRAGIKLEKAIARLGVDLRTKQVLDIGQSTGGFTDCALEHGARRVVGIDVGHSQLHKKLRSDPRCFSVENLHVKDIKNSQAFLQLVPAEKFDFLIVDVSFISLNQVVPHLVVFLKPLGKFLVLVKPQFELENSGRTLDQQFYSFLEKSMRRLFEENFGQVDDYFQSELQGKDGTTEFFIYGKKTIETQY
jgi:23S rRNA (cytidine1920-2'-O)/16S rRNA (cytidine1409-2'-O)-methyltransferase